MDPRKQIMAMKLETFNEIWESRIGRKLTQEEFNRELVEFPELVKSYHAQEIVTKKYKL